MNIEREKDERPTSNPAYGGTFGERRMSNEGDRMRLRSRNSAVLNGYGYGFNLTARKALVGHLTLCAIGLAAVLLTLLIVGVSYGDDRKVRKVTFFASGVRTAATAQSSGFDVSAYTEGQILVNVTAEGGVSTLDIIIETSDDDSTYYTHTTMSQITAIGKARQAITNFGKYVRLNYTVGGTSFTFAAVGVFKN